MKRYALLMVLMSFALFMWFLVVQLVTFLVVLNFLQQITFLMVKGGGM